MPKTKEQYEAIKTASVENIKDTAVKLFAKKGLAGTSISEIAKEAGISMGLMYHYYSSKEDLYTELVKFAVTSANEFMTKLQAENISAKEKIQYITQDLLSNLQEENSPAPYYFVLMNQTMLSTNLPKTTEIYTEKAFESAYILRAIIEAGQKTGEIKSGDPMSLATLYLSTQHGLYSFKLMEGNSFSLPDVAWINEMLINK